MSIEHLESNTTDQMALANDLPPDSSAQVSSETPSDGQGESRETGEESWDDVNARLSGSAEADDQDGGESEMQQLAKLKEELENERKARATAEKRMKDSQRAFRERSEELKRIREEQEALNSSTEKTQQLKDDVASGNVAAPQNEAELDQFAKDHGLTEEEKEFFELYPEGMTAMDKILSKRLDTGLSEREKAKEAAEKEARAKQLEAELYAEEEAKWLSGVKSYHPDVDGILEDKSFNAWLQANDALRASILAEKDKFDPTGLTEILDIYKGQKAEIDRVRARRDYGRQASVSPRANTGSKKKDDSGEKTWAQINADLKKQRSR
jgi:hypothetical protein